MKNNEIAFASMIYPKAIIQKAITDYQSICRIQMEQHTDYVLCTFLESITDIDLTICEFSNYLIELLNSEVSNGFM